MNQDVVISNMLYIASEKGFNIGDFECLIGLSKGYFSRLKRNRNSLSLKTVLNALDLLKCPAQMIFDEHLVQNAELKSIELKIDALVQRRTEIEKELRK